MNASEIIRIRGQLGLSQAQLANLLGVHTLTVSKWERELLRPTPHQEALLKSFSEARKANKEIGEEAKGFLIAGAVVLALYVLLEASVEGQKGKR